MMAPKHESSDASNSDMPKKEALMCFLYIKRWKFSTYERKKIHAEVGKIANKKEFSIREIVKKEKEIYGSFATQTAKIMAGVQGKCFVK